MKRIARPAQAERLAARRAAFDSLPLAVFLADAGGALVYCNARFYEQTGTAATTALGEAWLELAVPEQRAGLHERYRTGIARMEAFVVEARFLVPEIGRAHV